MPNLKRCARIVILSMGLLFSMAFAATTSDPEVVATVDLERYSGTWLEIAHSPNFFQKSCVSSKAIYKVKDSSSISVYNICYKEKGISDIEGVATIQDPSVPAKLRVRFNFFARGDYWITDLDEEYQWAVVSGPGKKSLFILARSAPMKSELLKTIIDKLKSKGFNTAELIYDKYEISAAQK